MIDFVSGIKKLFTVRYTIAIVVVVTLGLIFFVLYMQNGSAAFQVSAFTFLTLSERFQSFFITFFDLTSAFTLASLTLTIFSALLGGFSASALYAYYSLRKQVFEMSTLALSGIAYAVALIGLECGACGAVLATSFLSLFGGAWLLQALPFHGFEIGVLGVCIQAILFYNLIKKLSNPYIC